MTHASDSGVEFLAPVSGSCVIGFTHQYALISCVFRHHLSLSVSVRTLSLSVSVRTLSLSVSVRTLSVYCYSLTGGSPYRHTLALCRSAYGYTAVPTYHASVIRTKPRRQSVHAYLLLVWTTVTRYSLLRLYTTLQHALLLVLDIPWVHHDLFEASSLAATAVQRISNLRKLAFWFTRRWMACSPHYLADDCRLVTTIGRRRLR